MSVCVVVTRMRCAKMAEPIEMPFAGLTLVYPRNHTCVDCSFSSIYTLLILELSISYVFYTTKNLLLSTFRSPIRDLILD